MPTAVNGDVALYYETDGDGETVAFVGDAGFGAWQWAWQHAAVAGPFEALVLDQRGVGRSDAPPGPYDVATLAADLEAVLAHRGARTVHLVGAGLGGMVALRHAMSYGRARSLALFGTAASGAGLDPAPLFAPPDDPGALRESLSAALTDEFRERRPDSVDRIVDWRGAEDADRAAWEAQVDAIRGFDVTDRLHELAVPALVVHGTRDAVWPPARGEALAEGLPRGRHHPVDAGHLAWVEASAPVNDELVGFLERHAADDRTD